MSDPAKPVFLVDPHSDPVVVRIEGRASFQNSGGLKDFIGEMVKQGKSRFVLDFAPCTGMDSTFLGVLAGAALRLREQQPPGTILLARLSPRNQELVRNLGLHRLLEVDPPQDLVAGANPGTPLSAGGPKSENARLVLEAHESLVAADEGNRGKFQDVLTFMRNRAK